MPSDSSGTYTLVSGYAGTANTPILTSQHNPVLEDIASALTARIMANGAKAMSGPLTLSGDPSADNHAARKAYVDAQVAALVQKATVINRTTANITLSGEQTLDGVLTASSRVLVMAQTAPAENGIYVSGAGAWARATDMDAWTEVPGAIVVVQQGTLYADSVWFCTANTGGTLGTTAINFARLDLPLQKRNTQTGTTYTVLASDLGKFVTTSNGSAIAVTVPQATSAFGDGFWFITQNLGAGAATFTPTTSTVNAGATLVLRTGDAYLWTSDGTNYIAVPLGPAYEWLTALTTDGTGATGDFVWTADVSATLNKKMTLATIQTLFAAPQSTMETGTSTATNVTPGGFVFHDGSLKGWTAFNGTGTPTATDVFNFASGSSGITDNGAGDYTLTYSTAFSTTSGYALSGMGNQIVSDNMSGNFIMVRGTAASAVATASVRINAGNVATGSPGDKDYNGVMFSGDR